MNAYIERVLSETKRKNPAEPEFVQTVEEVLSSLEPVIDKHPEYEKVDLLNRMVEYYKTMRRTMEAKIATGTKDLWSYMTKNTEDVDWDSKGELEYAQTIVYNESCKACHVNIFPSGMSDEGVTAHLYYDDNEEKLNLQCISCHLDVGHYNPNYKHSALTEAPVTEDNGIVYEAATPVTEFANFVETIPGTGASIKMVAIPGGTPASTISAMIADEAAIGMVNSKTTAVRSRFRIQNSTFRIQSWASSPVALPITM